MLVLVTHISLVHVQISSFFPKDAPTTQTFPEDGYAHIKDVAPQYRSSSLFLICLLCLWIWGWGGGGFLGQVDCAGRT